MMPHKHNYTSHACHHLRTVVSNFRHYGIYESKTERKKKPHGKEKCNLTVKKNYSYLGVVKHKKMSCEGYSIDVLYKKNSRNRGNAK